MINIENKNKLFQLLSGRYQEEQENEILRKSTLRTFQNINLLDKINKKLKVNDAQIVKVKPWRDVFVIATNYNNNSNGAFFIYQNSNFELMNFYTTTIENGTVTNFNKIVDFEFDPNNYIIVLFQEQTKIKIAKLNDILSDFKIINSFFIENREVTDLNLINGKFAKLFINDKYISILVYVDVSNSIQVQYGIKLFITKYDDMSKINTINGVITCQGNYNFLNIYDFTILLTFSDDGNGHGTFIASFKDNGTVIQKNVLTETNPINFNSNQQISNFNNFFYELKKDNKNSNIEVYYNNNRYDTVKIDSMFYRDGWKGVQCSSGGGSFVSCIETWNPAVTKYFWQGREIYWGNDVGYNVNAKLRYYHLTDFRSASLITFSTFIIDHSNLSENYSYRKDCYDVGNVKLVDRKFYASFKDEGTNNNFEIFTLYKKDSMNVTQIPVEYSTTQELLLTNFEKQLITFSSLNPNSQITSICYSTPEKKKQNKELMTSSSLEIIEQNFIVKYLTVLRENNLIKIFAFDENYNNFISFQNSYNINDSNIYFFKEYNNISNNFNSVRILGTNNNLLEFDNNIINIPIINNNITFSTRIDEYSLNQTQNKDWFIYSNTNTPLFNFFKSIDKQRNQVITLNFDLTFNVTDKTNKEQILNREQASNNLTKLFINKDVNDIKKNLIKTIRVIFEDEHFYNYDASIYWYYDNVLNSLYFNISILNLENKIIDRLELYNDYNNIVVSKKKKIKPRELLDLSIKVDFVEKEEELKKWTK